MEWTFQEQNSVNEEELAIIHEYLDKLASKIYNECGPEGTYYIIDKLTEIMNDDISLSIGE